ncbi:LysR family transcriptional regulator [Sphingomonas sp. LB3N6]|uniref:LysR family transcriptional regulator n=1 Tax=Sphingomonas fucosidasi TaxID=3096164 RepID=UPI002FC6B8C6
MIDIRQMRLLIAVAEELHFGRAAARIGMAQPPFSQQILKLERDLGVDLLLRTSRRVSLTPAGAELLRSARDLIARRDQAVERVIRTANGNAGTLRVGFAASSAIGILPPIIQKMRAELPDVILQLDDRDGADFARLIRADALDAAIVRAPFQARGIVVESLHSEPFVAVFPNGHPLSERDSLTPGDLADSPFILFPRAASPGLHDTIIGMCIGSGFSPAIVQEAGAWLSVVSLVESGLGITIAPSSAARHCPSGVAFVRIRGTEARAELATARGEGPASPLVKRFLDIARSLVSVPTPVA